MEAVFLKILNMSISAGFLILAVCLLRVLLKRAPKYIRCILWGIVGLRLLLPWNLQSVLSLIPSAETVPPTIAYDPVPAIRSGMPAVNRVVNPPLAASMAPVPTNSANPMQVWLFVAAVVWAAVAAGMLLWMAGSYLHLRFRLREAIHLRDNLWQSDRIDAPFVLGLARPRIYLPFGLDAEALGPVVAHEEAHIRRRDHWIKPAAFLLLSVHWFNPLVWLAYILLCRDIELACDERVVRDMEPDGRRAYSEALLACSMPRHRITVCPVAFGESGVKARIRSVLSYKRPSFWIILAALLLCAVTAVCFLTNPPDKPESPAAPDFSAIEAAPAAKFEYAPDAPGYKYVTSEIAVLNRYFPSLRLKGTDEPFDEPWVYRIIFNYDVKNAEPVAVLVGSSKLSIGGRVYAPDGDFGQILDAVAGKYAYFDYPLIRVPTLRVEGRMGSIEVAPISDSAPLPNDLPVLAVSGSDTLRITPSQPVGALVAGEKQYSYSENIQWREDVRTDYRPLLPEDMQDGSYLMEVAAHERDSRRQSVVTLETKEYKWAFRLMWYDDYLGEDKIGLTYEPIQLLYRSPDSTEPYMAGTEFSYTFYPDFVLLRNNNTEQIIEFPLTSWEPIRPQEWKSWFASPQEAPDLGLYDDPQMMVLSDEYRIFDMDGEYWAANFRGESGIWTLYRLTPYGCHFLTLSDVLRMASYSDRLTWAELNHYYCFWERPRTPSADGSPLSGGVNFRFPITDTVYLLLFVPWNTKNTQPLPPNASILLYYDESSFTPPIDLRGAGAADVVVTLMSSGQLAPIVRIGYEAYPMVPNDSTEALPLLTYTIRENDPQQNSSYRDMLPFHVYYAENEFYGGWYTITDEATGEALDFVHPSGLAAQTYILQNCRPGRTYRITMMMQLKTGETKPFAFRLYVAPDEAGN